MPVMIIIIIFLIVTSKIDCDAESSSRAFEIS